MKRLLYKEISTFLLITILLSTGLFIVMFQGMEDSLIVVIPMMFTPGISAIITSSVFGEKLSTFGWQLGRFKHLAASYLIPLFVALLAYGLFWLTKFADFSVENVVNYRWAKMLGFRLPVPAIIGILSKMTLAFLITSLVVFGEEVGWTGFLTRKLLQLYSVPVTSIIVGGFWSIWHYPAIIGGFYGTGTPLWISLPGFTLVLIGASFVRTYMYQKSNSLWTGVVVHASHNVIVMGMFLEMTRQTTNLDINIIVSETGIYLGIVYVLVSVLLWSSFFSKKR